MGTAGETAEVVVIGAGLAGLACASELQKRGVRVKVYESAARVGGRVQTDELEGFRLDRGFQVLLDAYPEAATMLDYAALSLRRFEPGAMIWTGDRFHGVHDPFRRPSKAAQTLLAPVGTLFDKFRLAMLRRQLCAPTPSGSLPLDGSTVATEDYLREFGFTPSIIERFFRPFYGGVFLERELKSSAEMFGFTFRMFAIGHAVIPALGMGEIPAQLASRLDPGTVILNHEITSIQDGVAIDDVGTRLESNITVVATDASSAAQLLGEPVRVPWRSTECIYFHTEELPVARPVLFLNGEPGGLVGSAHVVTALAPEAAPQGQHLISVTLRASESQANEKLVREELARWFGSTVGGWRMLRHYRIAQALPGNASTLAGHAAKVDQRSPKVLICGDHVGGASIQGALASGRAAAERILELRSTTKAPTTRARNGGRCTPAARKRYKAHP